MSRANQIVIKRRIHGGLLLFAWILLILLPGLLFQVSFTELLKFALNFNSKQIKPQMILEMELFKEDLDPEGYLKRKLTKLGKEFSHSQIEYSSLNLKQFIVKKLGINPSLIVVHGKDTENIQFWKSEKFNKLVGPMPKTLTHRFIISVNNQPFCDFYSGKLQAKYKGLTSAPVWDKFLAKNNIFFQKKLGLISQIQLENNTVAKTISGKFAAPIYFFYQAVKEDNRILKGFLIAITGKNLPAKKIIAESLSSTNKRIKRKLVFASKKETASFRKNLDKISVFKPSANGLKLHSILPQSILSSYIQAGGIYPENLKMVEKNMPLLEIFCAKKDLEHQISKWSELIIDLSKIFILIAGVFLLRTYFYGFDFNMGIQSKLMVGLLIVAVVPFLMLIISYSIYSDFEKEYIESAIEQELARTVALIQTSFENFLSNKQLLALRLGEVIADKSQASNAEIIQLVQSWIKGSNSAVDVIVAFGNRGFQQINNPKVFKRYQVDKDEKSLRKLLSTSMVDFCFDDGKVDYGENVSVLTQSVLNGEFLSQVLDSNGKLYNFSRFKTGSMYSTVKLIGQKSKKFIGMLSIRFHKELLIKEFLKQNRSKFSLTKPVYNYRLNYDYYFLRFSNGYFTVENASEDPKPVLPDLTRKILLAKEKNQVLSWKESYKKEKHLEFIKLFSKFPFVIRASAVSEQNIKSIFLPVVGLLSYLGFILIVLYKLLGEIYLKPVKEFVRVSNEVESGNYNVIANIEGNDEFQDLKTAFANMTKGLIQKEKLSRFVSDDVMEIVKAESDEGLQPGGAKVEASIMFIGLEGFENIAKKSSAEETIALLDTFIEAGSRLSAENHGVLDKVIEGTLMLVFREKQSREIKDHALRAAKTALDLQTFLKSENIPAHVGIASGTVVSGRIGSRNGKLDYTVIGDTVNLAARLKGNAKKASTSGIVLAPSTIRKLRGKARVNFIERVSIKGKTRDFSIYELLSLR